MANVLKRNKRDCDIPGRAKGPGRGGALIWTIANRYRRCRRLPVLHPTRQNLGGRRPRFMARTPTRASRRYGKSAAVPWATAVGDRQWDRLARLVEKLRQVMELRRGECRGARNRCRQQRCIWAGLMRLDILPTHHLLPTLSGPDPFPLLHPRPTKRSASRPTRHTHDDLPQRRHQVPPVKTRHHHPYHILGSLG